MIMPFGKYKGRDVRNLPDEYIEWLTTIKLRQPFRAVVRAEVNRRARGQHSRKPEPKPAAGLTISIPPDELALARRVFAAGYRSVALALHPDTGGNPEEMLRLNRLAESVRDQFQDLEEVKR